MNSVSWFLYLADVAGSLKETIIPLGGIILFASVPLTICGIAIHAGNHSWVPQADKDLWEARRKNCAKLARTMVPVGLALLIFAALIPSKSTMFAIAASQVGEQVVQSEQVQGIASDATKALHQWIKKQIEPEKK